MSESEAVVLAQTGDTSAFSYLYQQYRPFVYSQCRKMLKDGQDAEDLTQDVFMVVLRKIQTFRQQSDFKTWLYRLTKNLMVSHIRKSRMVVGEVLERSEPANQYAHVQLMETYDSLSDLQRDMVRAESEGKRVCNPNQLRTARRRLYA